MCDFVLCVFVLVLPGNCLGQEGCDALREVMDGLNMGDLLGSLRYWIEILNEFILLDLPTLDLNHLSYHKLP